jgi:hypothetical protein
MTSMLRVGGMAAAARLAACDGVHERDYRAIKDRASQLKRFVVKEGPKGNMGQVGLAPEVAGYSGFGIRQRLQQLFKRAGLEGKDEVHCRPTEDHTRRAREGYLDPHGTEVLKEATGEPAGSPAGPMQGG